MPRIKIMLLSLAAMLSIGLTLSSSASAVSEYFVENAMIPAEVSANPFGTFSDLTSTVNGKSILIQCLAVNYTEGKLKNMGGSTGKFAFTGCSLFEMARGGRVVVNNCNVPNFEFRFEDKLIAGAAVEDEFKPTAGVTFVTVKIEGPTCPALLAGNYKVEGTYVASFDAEIGQEKGTHVLTFTSTGSRITFGGIRAALAMTVWTILENSKPWYALP
jgi:hypothetical protein